MKKSKILRTATAWSIKDIVNHYLNEGATLGGGYINAKYRDIEITVEVKKVDDKIYDSGE